MGGSEPDLTEKELKQSAIDQLKRRRKHVLSLSEIL